MSRGDVLSSAINKVDDTLSVRVPDDSETLALIRHFGGALAVSSANISAMPPCETRSEILAQFGDAVLPVGAEKAGCGVASTVLDVCDDASIKLLREGPVTLAEIDRVLATQ